jgi:hypothetical protein
VPHIGAQVREEQHKAEHQRRKLAAALEAKRGPLLQSKERFAMRKARPDREAVQVRTSGETSLATLKICQNPSHTSRFYCQSAAIHFACLDEYVPAYYCFLGAAYS